MSHSEMDMTSRDYEIKQHKDFRDNCDRIDKKIGQLMQGDYLVLTKAELGIISSCLKFRASSEHDEICKLNGEI